MAEKLLYKVVFFNQGKVYEVYAKSVSEGSLFGFIEIEQLVFGERSGVLVDPAEERLKSEFAGVTRSFLPMHAIIRIDQVEEQGVSKISNAEGNVMPFPQSVYTPGEKGDQGGSGGD